MRPRNMPLGRRMRLTRRHSAMRLPRLRRDSRADLRVRPQHLRERVQDAHARLPGWHQRERATRPI